MFWMCGMCELVTTLPLRYIFCPETGSVYFACKVESFWFRDSISF